MSLLSPVLYSQLMRLFYHRQLRDRIATLIDPQRGLKLLDLACGSGDLRGVTVPCHYIGTDIDPGRVRRAAASSSTHVVSDAGMLPFRPHSFDRILAAGLFHHVSDESATAILSEMARVLKPSGRAVVLDAIWPRRWYNVAGLVARRLDDGRFVRHPKDYERLFSGSFVIRSLEYPSRLSLEFLLGLLESPRRV